MRLHKKKVSNKKKLQQHFDAQFSSLLKCDQSCIEKLEIEVTKVLHVEHSQRVVLPIDKIANVLLKNSSTHDTEKNSKIKDSMPSREQSVNAPLNSEPK